ncbi:MAG: glutamine synthetase [Pseudonocardia sp.]
MDLVRVVFCDPHGLARSKTLAAESFRHVLRHGIDFSPGPFLFDTGHAVAVDFLAGDPGVGVSEIAGAGDFVVVPDPSTFQLLPSVEPRTAWVIGDEFLRDGTRHPLSSRDVLRRIAGRFEEHAVAPVIGLEIEWYLTISSGGPPGYAGNGFGTQGRAPAVHPVNAGYQFNLDTYLDSVADVVGPLSVMLGHLGLPLRSMEHESGPGQLEFTFEPLSATDAADAALLFRTFVKQFCRRRGFHASFMALPGLESFDPSGWHLHQSVVRTDRGTNSFAPAEPATDDLSPQGRAYVRGVLDQARDFCILAVPTINGYRRFRPEFVLSPTRIEHSVEDRSAMVRVQGEGDSTHIENRIGEPCANPYLYIASQLSAGLDGMTGSSRPGAESSHAPVPALPTSLREALDAFCGSDRASDLLGRPLMLTLARLKASEVARYEAWAADAAPSPDGVTEWEQREYFEIY